MGLINNDCCEIWKDVFGWEGLYAVSNLSRVKRISNIVRTCGTSRNYTNRIIKERVLKGSIDKAGYYRIDLRNGPNRTNALLHRLVAKAFIPNPENKPQINHIDGNKTNNRVSNLEWCTHKENMRHGYKNGLIPIKTLLKNELSIASKLNNSQVIEIKCRLKNGDRVSDIAKDYPVTRSAIGEIKYGRSWANL